MIIKSKSFQTKNDSSKKLWIMNILEILSASHQLPSESSNFNVRLFEDHNTFFATTMC